MTEGSRRGHGRDYGSAVWNAGALLPLDVARERRLPYRPLAARSPSPWEPLCISPFERGGKWLGERVGFVAVKKVWLIAVPRAVAAPWPPRGRLGAVCAEVLWVRFVHPLRAALRSHASPSRSEGEDLLFALLGRLLENIGS